MNDNDDVTINFTGANNDSISIPDPAPKGKGPLDPNSLNIDSLDSVLNSETLKQILPADLFNQIEQEAAASGKSLDDVLNEAISSVKDSGIDLDSLGESPTNKKDSTYSLGDSAYLDPAMFGSVSCLKDSNLYDDFLRKYGDDTSKYLDETSGVTNFIVEPSTAGLLKDTPISKMDFVLSNDYFILFFAHPEDETKYGFFISAFKDEKGEFTMYIPEFRNSTYVDEAGNLVPFNIDVNDTANNQLHFFDKDENDELVFKLYDPSSVSLSVFFILAPMDTPLLSPHRFGNIKRVMPNVTKNSNLLKIGDIIPNEDEVCNHFIADMDLFKKDSYPLYINFGVDVDKESLIEMAKILMKTDMNKCKLLDYTELRCQGDKLYINVHLGEF